MSDLTITERTRVKRLHELGSHDRETIHAILDAGLLCHVGYVIGGAPYVTPTFHWREGDRLFWHGSSASRMLRNAVDGVEVCLTVTHFDGIVFARSGYNHSANYRSVMVFGKPEKIEDDAEKTRALEVFMDRLAKGRWQDSRGPSAQELKATTVLSMPIDEASAKVSAGPPEDEEEDYALSHWAGVVPVRMTVGEPEDCPRLADGTPMPDYLRKIVVT